MIPDLSNGYEQYAGTFIRSRDPRIGTDVVRAWAEEFARGATVLELGCGHGVISRVLLERGLRLFAIDASPSLLQAFRRQFADVETECCSAEDSTLFGRSFDGVVAWGLLFLLEAKAQGIVLTKVAKAIRPGGRFLFTAPRQAIEWTDVLTGLKSRSCGAEAYEAMLREQGMQVTRGTTDEGENYYYFATKPRSPIS